MASSGRKSTADNEAAVKGEALVNCKAAKAGNINEVTKLLEKNMPVLH